MSTTSNDTATQDNGTVKKVNRRTFTERLSDLSLEEKVQVVKDLKSQIDAEVGKRQLALKEANDLTKEL